MSNKVNCGRVSSLVSALVLLWGPASYAANGVWNGTQSAYWTNSANWTAAYPAGNQTASFTNSGNGNITIDLSGLTFGCSNIVFDTANTAPYTLGAFGINQQTLMFTNNSYLRMSSSVASNQTVNALIQLGHDRSASTHNFRNDTTTKTLFLAGNVTAPASGTAGGKTVNLLGSGPITISGDISIGGASSLMLTNSSLGLVTLTGSNRITTVASANGPMTLSGTNFIDTLYLNTDRVLTLTGTNTIMRLDFYGSALPATVAITAGSFLALTNSGGQMLGAYQDTVINGPGSIVLQPCHINNGTGDNYAAPGKTLTINAPITGPNGLELWSGGAAGTYVLNGSNDFAGNVTMGPAGTLSVSKIGNKGSYNSNLGRGTTLTLGANGTRLLYTGAGETADRTISLNASVVIEQAGSGYLNLSAPLAAGNANAKTLTLQGPTGAAAEFSGLLSNAGGGTLSLIKAGTGIWILTTNNTFTGTTAVNAGTLALSGVNGTLLSSTGYTLAGGTLLLDNTTSASNTNRLRDASAITLSGGTLRFSNDGGAADFAENVGAVTVAAGNSTIATVQAAAGQTATLRLASLAQTVGGAVNFTGTGLGLSDRNRIFITGQPDGLIGPWATVDGARLAAYSSAAGVYAAAEAAYTDIAARGPSTIVSNDSSNVRINTAGTSGPIELSASVTRVASLLQNTTTPAEINTAGKALQTAGIIVPANHAAVTVGQASGDGTLASLSAGGDLALNTSGADPLTVNAVIADNGSASRLSKSGTGAAKLTAANTFSGAAGVAGGSLVLAHSNALQNSTLSTAGSVFDSSVSGHAFNIAALSGSFDLALADNAGTPNAVALTVGKNNASTTLSGALSGNGSLTKTGSGTLTLSGASTFGGGLTVQQGTVAAGSANALGLGGVVNEGTLNLTYTGSDITYSGLATSLSGAGTVNVWLSTGGSSTRLNGDFSGFTGVLNIGTNAGAGAAKVILAGKDNAAAKVNVLSNGTLYCATPVQHNAALTLKGGDTGEIYGQLRLEGNAVWAGPVTLAGPSTTLNDGLLGSSSGLGTITGAIGDGGAGFTLDKVGAGTIYLAGPSTYAGPTWIKYGTLRVDTLGSVGGGASPLGSPLSAAQGTIKFGHLNTNGVFLYTGQGETSDRRIDLAGTTGGATLDHSGTNLLKLTGGMTLSGTGAKTLTLQGSTIGTGEFAGVISNGVGSMISLNKAGSGTWTLSGDNTFTGSVTLTSGTLVAAHPHALGANNWVLMPNTVAALDFANSGVGETAPSFQMNAGTVATLKSNRDTPGEGISHLLNELWMSSVTTYFTNGANVVSGTPKFAVNLVNLWSGGANSVSVLAPYGVDLSVGTITIASNNVANKAIQLDGISTGNVVAGSISNGLNTVLLTKSNTGTWTLLGSNTYSGATVVNKGLLAVDGPSGAILGTSGITLSGNGVLELRNSEQTNLTDRLRDAAAVTMAGGTLRFAHAAGLTNYSEKIGAVTVSAGTNQLFTSQADVGYTSAVTLAALSRTSPGLLDFSGEGLGVDDRNRVFIGGSQPEGLIGLWATVNATNFAAYSNAVGVIAAGEGLFTDIPAKGPYAITDDPALNARIASMGTEGPLALAGATTSRLKALLQDSAYDSTIGMTSQVLQVSDIMIAADRQDLTLGTQENEGLVMPAAAGGSVALINNSGTNTLTVNAGVTNNTSTSAVAKYGAGAVKIGGKASYTGTTLINEGSLEFGGPSASRLSGVISGAGTLVKSGTNLLHLLGANTFTGPVYVNAGIIRPDQNNAFGTTNGGVFIASGATLDLSCDSGVGGTRGQDSINMGAEQFTVSGAGADGAGAIICNSVQQANAINRVSLAGNTTFGGSKRWDLRSNSPRLDLNDYTLTKTGINEIAIISTTVNPGAGHMVVNQGLLRWETFSTFNGDSANTVTVNNGGIFELYQLFPAVPAWTLILNEGAFFRGSCGANYTATNINGWAGPVTLNGRAFFNGNASPCNWTVVGDISGAGTLVKAGNGGTTLWLMGTNNTYEGETIISNGTLYAKVATTLPGYNTGKVTVCGGGTLAIPAGDGTNGWSLTQIGELYTASTFTNNGTTFGVLSVDTTQTGVDCPLDITKTLGLTKVGTNSLHLGGANTFKGPLTISGGDVLIDASADHNIGQVTIGQASLAVNNDTRLFVYGTNTFVGVNAADFGQMTLSGKSVWGMGLSVLTGPSGYMSVGHNGRGVLTIQDNAVLTNKIIVGNGTGSHGAIYQRDSTVVHNWCGQANDGRIGQSGYGYYELSSGTMTNMGYFQVGVGTAAVGILSQYGGTFHMANKYNGQLGISRGGTGIVYVAGGTFNSYIGVNVGEASENSLLRGFAEFTVAGSGQALVAGTLNLADRTNMFATVNLNGGRLTANMFSKSSSRFGSVAQLNFNGGTFRARTAGNLFGTGANTLDGVYVYPGGATFDSTNLAVTANACLLAPSGNGVASITVAPRGGYIGPPMVTISGGGGSGATAIADFDSDSGFVTGVTITCPGRDYTSVPTVTLAGGGTNLQTIVTGVTLAPNTSGGFTKLGAGTLTLTGTNTYGGTTTLGAGTLKLGHALALPAATTFTFAGGTLDLNGLTLTNAVNTTGAIAGGITNGSLVTVFSPAGENTIGSQTVSMSVRASGSLSGTYLFDAGEGISCDQLAVQGDIDLSNIDLRVVNTAALDGSLPYTILTCTGARTGTFKSHNLPDSRWKLVYSADGSVKLIFVNGTVMFVR